jgi:hypothetical protein
LATTAFCVGFAGVDSAGVTSAGSTTSICAVSPGASPSGLDTVAPAGVEGAAEVALCASPRGFETVAPWGAAALVFEVELVEVAKVVVEAEPSEFATVAPLVGETMVVDGDVDAAPAGGNPKGFVTVAPWTAGVAVFELAGVDVAEGAVPSGLATVAVVDGAEVAGGCDTVAESTFDVTFAAPAELLGVGAGFGATAAGEEALAVVALVAVLDALLVAAGVAGVESGALFEVVAAALVFAAGATLTAIEEGWPVLGGKLEGAAVFTVTPDAFGGASVAADCLL